MLKTKFRVRVFFSLTKLEWEESRFWFLRFEVYRKQDVLDLKKVNDVNILKKNKKQTVNSTSVNAGRDTFVKSLFARYSTTQKRYI